MTVSLASFIQNTTCLLEEKQIVFPGNYLVAYSGGLDSTVLLDLLLHWRQQNPAIRIRAIHINHQLQTAADDWQALCQAFCDANTIEFIARKVVVNSADGGIEAAARAVRYQAFAAELKPAEILLTAHHLDDQVETLLLRLLRGSGLEGAAAMRDIKKFESGWLMRPLLHVSRKELESYAIEHGLQWVDDPTNLSNDYDRNFLRNEIFPRLEQRWPSYRKTLSRFAGNAQQHNDLLQQYIKQDFVKCLSGNELDIAELKKYSRLQQTQIVRHWIKTRNIESPSEKHLQEIFKLIDAREDAIPLVSWADFEMRRFQNKLFLQQALAAFDNSMEIRWNPTESIYIPGSGSLSCITSGDAELPRVLVIKFRQGGEVCKIPGRQGHHSLKKLMQEKSIPPWLRERLPILVLENEIVAIPGIFSALEACSFQWLPSYMEPVQS